MFAALGTFAVRRRRWVLVGALVFLVLGGAWGSGATGTLSGGGGFDVPNSPSVHADNLLAGPLGRDVTDIVAVYSSTTATVDDPTFAQAVRHAVAGVPRGNVARLTSYWSTNDPAYVSRDRHATYVGVQLKSADAQTEVKQFQAIQSSFAAPGLTLRFGGTVAMTEQVNRQSARDIARAELFSLPVLLILLILLFGSVIAASLPLAIGVLAVIGSLVVLRAVTLFIPLSTFAIEMVSVLGLGLAIDYALLIVSRYREELDRGRSVDDAVRRTVATAGRTVAFSALTVAVSLLGLLLFPSRFLLSMGYAGTATVLFAALSSLTVLPALLRVAGHRVNAWRVPLPRSRRSRLVAADPTQGRWYRVAHAVMRRPLVSAVGIAVVLVLVGLPILGANWARPGDWVLPVGADARAVTAEMATDFAADPAKIITGVVELPGSANSPQAQAELTSFARRLAGVPGVHGATVTGTYRNLARVTLGYSMDPMSRAAWTMVRDVRAQVPPAGSTASFTGMPASRVDIVGMIGSRIPWMGLFIAIVSFIVLFLAFGSVVIPLKSVVFNLLSLSASFGLITLIFQDGFGSGVLNFVPVGAIDANFPVLIVAIAFGLSMDYEVFLLSRVREERLLSGNDTEAMAVGLQRTARIITSAALLMVIVVGGYVTSGITFMKMIGVGLAIAVIVDATIVRGLLVPATMRLLGKWAWWAPAPLARWWSRYGLPEPATAQPVGELAPALD